LVPRATFFRAASGSNGWILRPTIIGSHQNEKFWLHCCSRDAAIRGASQGQDVEMTLLGFPTAARHCSSLGEPNMSGVRIEELTLFVL
jgi:hypothetical protein